MILIIDNYDSFTYNLDHMIQKSGEKTIVLRNDCITEEMVEKLAPKAIIISPGPGSPETAGNSMSILKKFFKKTPFLGVCLGHQIIGEFFGLNLKRCEIPVHGKSSSIIHDGKDIYEGLENGFKATRYHSLELGQFDEHSEISLSSVSEDGKVMGIRHKDYPIFGVQFHPESYETNDGALLVQNFLAKVGGAA